MTSQEKNILRMPQELIEDMNSHLPGRLTIRDLQTLRAGKPFKAVFYYTDTFMNTDISDMLDLSVRSSNALKRAGYRTVGDLIDRLDSLEDLQTIRNCGAKSRYEIMGKLFFYQYMQIPVEKRTAYMQAILALNGVSLT